MKTLDPKKLCSISIIVLLTGFIWSGFAADDPDDLLDWYLETGSLEFADKLREGFPGSPHAAFCDAWEYMGANDEKARELASALVQDHPDFAHGHFALATILTIGFNEYAEAIPIFDRSIEILPDFMLSYQYRGIAKIGLVDYPGAKEDFNKVLKLKRGYAEGFLLRGVANHELGDEEAMKADFEIGLQLNYMALAAIPGDLAKGAIDKAIETAPENAIYYYARGYSNFVKGNYRPASQDFNKCIELVTGNSDFYKYSGASKIQIDNFEGGQKDLNYALSINPDDPEIYYYLGVLMNDHIKQPAMAQEYMNHAIQLDEYNALYYYERSKAAFKMLDYDQARDDINMALKLDHRRGDFYAQRGNVKMKMGDPADDYCPDFRKALEWGTSYNLKRVMKKSCRE
ncbi:MAG TPA: hypothetical protein ENI20_03765 [Bacteroides sp.]|nr:hypothetical protein [Bacteroides sp.]